MSTDAGTVPQLVVTRARWSLMVVFLLYGVTQMGWLSRLPSIRASLDVSSAQLGAFLMVGAAGSLVSILVSGAVVTRYGSRATLVVGAVGNGVAQCVIAAAAGTGSAPLFVVGVLLNGLTSASMYTPINISAARVEQHVGRAILPHFHAAFSIGAALGALVSAGCSAAQVPVGVQMAVVAVTVAVVRLVLVSPATVLSPAPVRGDEASRSSPGRRRTPLRTALQAWAEPRTVLIGLVLLASALSEGSAGQWLSIAVVDGFHVREALGAVAYGTFVVAMTVVRFGGTHLIDRYGRVAVLRASGISGLLGLAVFGLAPTWWLAFPGIVLWGMGSALANPIAMAAASDDPARAAARVSVASSFMSVALISAPPMLGLLADAVGARHALMVIAIALVLSVSVAGQVRPQPAAESPTGTTRKDPDPVG
ncbi:MFS transporter [Antribacter gilvus]|uniref:MFS transporter n=1 Tax=Antribacter gilvus TaxID=2304675 RepID=UPI000F76C445|nr:MFS transporter [Antribacter gilvus]